MTAPCTPDRRRWGVVAAATLGMGAGFGGMTTVSSLIAPLESDLGVLRSDISLAYTLTTLGIALGGLYVGRLTDRYSTRPIVMAGAAIVGLALVLVAGQTRLAVIQGLYLTAGFLGFSCLYGPLLTTTALWFPDRGGLALGIVTMGGTIGQAVVPVAFDAIAGHLGWRAGLACLGLLYIGGVAPLLWFVRKPPVPVGALVRTAYQGWPLPHGVSVTFLAGAAMLCCVVMATPLVHLMPLALAGGADGETASAVMATMMGAGCISRVLAGVVADRFGALATYALVSSAQTATVCLFIVPPGGMALHAAAAAYGFAFGGVMTGLVCTVKVAVPSAMLGRSMSVVGLAAWVGMGAGGYQGGLCFDLTGSYATSFTNAALAGVANLAVLALLGLWLWRMQARSPMIRRRAA